MGLVIKNNLMAENAARHLGNSFSALSTSVERLSSGLRINSAKDDAAGLAVRELIRADIATLRQGVRNARDGISMLQTAEGALAAVDDILIRMKELAEQAATESYSTAQRTLMHNEFTELTKEITRIAETTDFNGVKLLNDSSTIFEIHLGSTDASDSTKVQIQGQVMDAATLSLTATKQFSVLSTHYASGTDAAYTLASSTGDGTITFDFAGDTDDAGAAMAAISVSVDFDTNGPSYTVNEMVDLINVASDGLQTGYKAASLTFDSNTNQYAIKLTANAAGIKALTVAGTATAPSVGASLLLTASWDDTAGDATGADISTKAGAILALDTVDAAITTKDTFRAKLGYLMNRLDAAAQVIAIQAENLLQAESRISDVDVATEMAAMTRNQVLAQAGISMLSQANSMPQMALQLLS